MLRVTNMPNHQADRNAAILWARDLMSRNDWLILDTETTGLGDDAEVIQVGILAPNARVLTDILVRPRKAIPGQATAIHGISNDDVRLAPSMIGAWEVIFPWIWRHEVVIYNADYDTRLLEQSLHSVGFDSNGDLIRKMRVTCAMLQYAAYKGEWNPYQQTYKWPKLPSGDHSAIGDCRATLAIIQEMAAAELSVAPHAEGEST